MNSGQWVVRYRAWNSNRPEPKRLCHVIPAKAGIQREGFLSVEGAAVGCRACRSRTLYLALPQRGRGFALYWERQARQDGVRFDTVRVFDEFGNQGKGVSTLPLHSFLSPPPLGEG